MRRLHIFVALASLLTIGVSSLHDQKVLGSSIRLQYDGEHSHHRGAVSASAASDEPEVANKLVGILYGELQRGLRVMQHSYFKIWIGTWITAIDWTAAVINTHVTSVLLTLTTEPFPVGPRPRLPYEEMKDAALFNEYFMQSVGYYFGENAFAIRNQAYDDMLWVVLGWLESLRLSKARIERTCDRRTGLWCEWYGQGYDDAFAHRARVFYDLASRGWDETVCGGGMVWNRRLNPYKNAITNQLFVAASINMYLHFQGDSIRSPFLSGSESDLNDAAQLSVSSHDSRFLKKAVTAYAWLKSSNMTNARGLYIDGYHITNHTKTSNGTGKCDERNEMVYTYNQGVILTGLRGLYEATGNTSYLIDGYTLISSVIKATGYVNDYPIGRDYTWSGLGRGGVLEDYCDASGSCNQDAQAFKGIYFLHLARFCEALPDKLPEFGQSEALREIGTAVRERHRKECAWATKFARRNAHGAYNTQSGDGKYGMWWNANVVRDGSINFLTAPTLPPGATDRFRLEHVEPVVLNVQRRDPNDRGRGRTVETQGGGVAVFRAAYQMTLLYSEPDDDDD